MITSLKGEKESRGVKAARKTRLGSPREETRKTGRHLGGEHDMIRTLNFVSVEKRNFRIVKGPSRQKTS